MIDPHRLILLREVARAGSFAGAAAALRHTPSAVSQQIAALERAVGIDVVRRSTRGVTLTEAGRVLLAAADSIHAELEVAEHHLDDLKSAGPRTLNVVTFSSAGEPLLAPALAELTRASDAERIDITVSEAEPPEALASLRAGAADLVLVYHFHTRRPPREWTAQAATYVPLVEDELRLLVSSDHRLADRASVSLSECADERWIHGWGDPGDMLDTLAAASGFRPEVACRSSDYRFVRALVGAGVGVALVPSLALTHHQLTAAVSLRPRAARYVGACLPKRQWRNRAAEALLEALRARADDLA